MLLPERLLSRGSLEDEDGVSGYWNFILHPGGKGPTCFWIRPSCILASVAMDLSSTPCIDLEFWLFFFFQLRTILILFSNSNKILVNVLFIIYSFLSSPKAQITQQIPIQPVPTFILQLSG